MRPVLQNVDSWSMYSAFEIITLTISIQMCQMLRVMTVGSAVLYSAPFRHVPGSFLDGFHKMSVFENGTMDADKDEIQFYHPYFQKDKPELLKNIKRKVTGSKHSSDSINGAIKGDELLKVLDDVKQLRGRQANVDSQLAAMKHENAVLWRELAMLRQKHIKQQQIVNKVYNKKLEEFCCKTVNFSWFNSWLPVCIQEEPGDLASNADIR